MTLIRLTGSQLHAARVMVGLSRDVLAERAGVCCRYRFSDSSTIGLAAFGQVVQTDQDVDLVGS